MDYRHFQQVSSPVDPGGVSTDSSRPLQYECRYCDNPVPMACGKLDPHASVGGRGWPGSCRTSLVANRFTGRTQVRVRCVCAPGGLGMSRKPGPAAVVPIRRPHGPDWAYPTDSARSAASGARAPWRGGTRTVHSRNRLTSKQGSTTALLVTVSGSSSSTTGSFRSLTRTRTTDTIRSAEVRHSTPVAPAATLA